MSVTTYKYVEFLDNNSIVVKALATTDTLITLNISDPTSLDLTGTAYASSFTSTSVHILHAASPGKVRFVVDMTYFIEIA